MLITLRNDLEELGRVGELLRAFGVQHGLPQKAVQDCSLALDEILTNIVSYGFPDGAVHEIHVLVEAVSSAITLRIDDDGVAFDPTSVAAPNLETPLETRPPGGLGIHFVRTLMHELRYRREGSRNILSMTRRL